MTNLTRRELLQEFRRIGIKTKNPTERESFMEEYLSYTKKHLDEYTLTNNDLVASETPLEEICALMPLSFER